jgi:hypothetical protein
MSSIQLGALSQATKKKAKAGKEYIYIPLSEELQAQVEDLIKYKQQEDAIAGAIKITGGELKSAAVQWAFERFRGRSDFPSSVKARGGDGGVVSIAFQNKYSAVDENKAKALRQLIGDELFDEHFEECVTISIDTTKIAADRVQDFIDNLAGIAELFDAIDALTVKSGYKVLPSFHTARHQDLTVEKNQEFHKILPCQVAIKTKGVTE